MRIHLPNPSRLKSVAKKLHDRLSAEFKIEIKLSECRELTARMLGFEGYNHFLHRNDPQAATWDDDISDDDADERLVQYARTMIAALPAAPPRELLRFAHRLGMTRKPKRLGTPAEEVVEVWANKENFTQVRIQTTSDPLPPPEFFDATSFFRAHFAKDDIATARMVANAISKWAGVKLNDTYTSTEVGNRDQEDRHLVASIARSLHFLGSLCKDLKTPFDFSQPLARIDGAPTTEALEWLARWLFEHSVEVGSWLRNTPIPHVTTEIVFLETVAMNYDLDHLGESDREAISARRKAYLDARTRQAISGSDWHTRSTVALILLNRSIEAGGGYAFATEPYRERTWKQDTERMRVQIENFTDEEFDQWEKDYSKRLAETRKGRN